MKRILLILLALCAALSLVACHNKTSETVPPADTDKGLAANGADSNVSAVPTNYVRFEMKNGGVFVIELLPEYAPETVAAFQQSISEHYYDGKTFYRVQKGDVIQAGDPESKEEINGEFSANGFAQNTLSHTRGVVSMVRRISNTSSKVNFMIVQGESQEKYDGKYAAFGRIVYGMETIDEIASTKVTDTSTYTEKTRPVVPQEIRSATFVEFSEDWANSAD